jgi:hypothetical protein
VAYIPKNDVGQIDMAGFGTSDPALAGKKQSDMKKLLYRREIAQLARGEVPDNQKGVEDASKTRNRRR